MHKNSSAPSNNIALWYYLGTKHLDFMCEDNSTLVNQGNTVLIISI